MHIELKLESDNIELTKYNTRVIKKVSNCRKRLFTYHMRVISDLYLHPLPIYFHKKTKLGMINMDTIGSMHVYCC